MPCDVNFYSKNMSDSYKEFVAIMEKHKSGELNDEKSFEGLKKIDFSLLSSFEINKVSDSIDAPWIPRQFAANVLKNWMRKQDQVLDEIRSYLFFNPSVKNTDVKNYVSSIDNPSKCNPDNFIIENIIEKLGTAGGTRSIKDNNPVKLGLIKVEATVNLSPSVRLENLFDLQEDTFLQTISAPDASIIIEFPSFMKVKLTGYTLWSIGKIKTKQESSAPKTWVINGSNDLNLPWTTIQRVTEQDENVMLLKDFDQKATFNVPNNNEFFHYFQFKVISNHSANQCIQLKRFDMNGIVLIKE